MNQHWECGGIRRVAHEEARSALRSPLAQRQGFWLPVYPTRFARELSGMGLEGIRKRSNAYRLGVCIRKPQAPVPIPAKPARKTPYTVEAFFAEMDEQRRTDPLFSLRTSKMAIGGLLATLESASKAIDYLVAQYGEQAG